MHKRLALICLISVFTVLIAPFIGGSELSLQNIFTNSASDAEIFWRIRLPRVLTAFIAGSALSLAGMIFQALFRNSLATPYTLGVASGASLGAAVYFLFSTLFLFTLPFGAALFAFAGAFAAMMLVYGLGLALKGNSILLIGVALNFSFSSIIMFIQYISGFMSSNRIIRFLIGSLDSASYATILITLPFLAVGLLAALLYRRELDLMMTGEEVAKSRGIRPERTKYTLYIICSLMIGAVVSVTGPIGFVGMMAPHICRILVGSLHHRLIPASFFFGGAFLLASDSFARTVIFPTEIPVGVITSMLGGPFFIFLLLRMRFPYR